MSLVRVDNFSISALGRPRELADLLATDVAS